MTATRLLIIKTSPGALVVANQLAVQLGDSPEGVDSFNDDNAYNHTGSSADPVEAHIIKVAVYPVMVAEVDAAIAGIDGISRYDDWDEAVGDLQQIDWLEAGE